MLYPKKKEPLTPELFQNPTREYRAAPFWSWNTKLDTDELCWQIEQLKKMGFGGINIHSRTGMTTEYLSEEFMDCVKACIDKAEAEDMLTWLYDEDRWPSGAAGGLVTKDHRFRERFLLLSHDEPDSEPLAVYDIVLNPDGTLAKGERIEKSMPAEGFKLYVSIKIAEDNPWYNGQAYLNTIDPASVQEFIKVTYDTYYRAVGDRFGKSVPAMFTDEPHNPPKNNLTYADDTEPVILAWADDLAETYTAACGEDLFEKLPELLWDLPDGKASSARYHYHNHITDRFAEAFTDQIGAWCAEHGIMFTGHVLGEDTLGQTHSMGEAMRSYRAFHLPGIDILADGREFNAAKQAQSVVRQYGREGMLSELYGVTNWDFDFRHHKLQGDWQAAMGVTIRVPHLSWVSMNGQSKRDYPATFNYQVPWYKEYPYIEDHFARLNTALTRGKAHCRVGVIHPIESYWLHWGTKENTEEIRKQMDARFKDLTEWLLKGLIDFDFISESLLPEQCPTDFDLCNGFPVGEMIYETVIIPPVETLRTTTIERLQRFISNGGRVIFLDDAPALANAVPSELPGQLYSNSEYCSFDRVKILDRLNDMRDVEIRDESGVPTDYLLYQMREEGENRWLFVCHSDNPANPDVPKLHHLRIRMRGEWELTLYNTLSGEIFPAAASHSYGRTVYETPFHDHDSLLLHMTPARELSVGKPTVKKNTKRELVCRFLKKMEYELEEPNVLLLDMPEYALNNEPYHPAEEILRLDDILHDRLGWSRRANQAVQPWVSVDKTMPHTLRLRYTFESEIQIDSAALALENANTCSVTLNGTPTKHIDGWYVDKCIGMHMLPPIVPGLNVLEIIMPYGKTANPEAIYVLGDFGVEVHGTYCTLTERPKTITFGDITRQGFPFYGGNLTYRMKTELAPGRYELEVSSYRAHLLRVTVDGVDQGALVYAPYRIVFDVTAHGEHTIELKLFGSRINTFGQLHHTCKEGVWWGPGSWRTKDSEWTYEYNLWQQGILKSPEIFNT